MRAYLEPSYKLLLSLLLLLILIAAPLSSKHCYAMSAQDFNEAVEVQREPGNEIDELVINRPKREDPSKRINVEPSSPEEPDEPDGGNKRVNVVTNTPDEPRNEEEEPEPHDIWATILIVLQIVLVIGVLVGISFTWDKAKRAWHNKLFWIKENLFLKKHDIERDSPEHNLMKEYPGYQRQVNSIKLTEDQHLDD